MVECHDSRELNRCNCHSFLEQTTILTCNIFFSFFSFCHSKIQTVGVWHYEGPDLGQTWARPAPPHSTGDLVRPTGALLELCWGRKGLPQGTKGLRSPPGIKNDISWLCQPTPTPETCDCMMWLHGVNPWCDTGIRWTLIKFNSSLNNLLGAVDGCMNQCMSHCMCDIVCEYNWVKPRRYI